MSGAGAQRGGPAELLRGPLPEDPDPRTARRQIEAFAPRDAAARAARERVLAFLAAHPEDAHRRSCAPGHLTASALVLDHAGERVLLGLHAKLGRWLQLGGHCDGDANLVGVAWREATEESGIAGLAVDPRPVDLDVHAIPARPGEPEHLHLDLRFLVRAPAGARARRSPESLELAWWTPEEARGLDLDPSLVRLLERGLERARGR